jgi:hypothetical protein
MPTADFWVIPIYSPIDVIIAFLMTITSSITKIDAFQLSHATNSNTFVKIPAIHSGPHHFEKMLQRKLQFLLVQPLLHVPHCRT